MRPKVAAVYARIEHALNLIDGSGPTGISSSTLQAATAAGPGGSAMSSARSAARDARAPIPTAIEAAAQARVRARREAERSTTEVQLLLQSIAKATQQVEPRAPSPLISTIAALSPPNAALAASADTRTSTEGFQL